MEVNSEEAGGEAGVVLECLLQVLPDYVPKFGASGLVEPEGETIHYRRIVVGFC